MHNKHAGDSFDLDIESDYYYSKTFGVMIGSSEESPGNNAMISLPDPSYDIWQHSGRVKRDFSPVILQSQLSNSLVFGARFYSHSLLVRFGLKILTS